MYFCPPVGTRTCEGEVKEVHTGLWVNQGSQPLIKGSAGGTYMVFAEHRGGTVSWPRGRQEIQRKVTYEPHLVRQVADSWFQS